MLNINIVLIGFMGSGKTLTSRELAKIFKRRTFSTDDLIQKKEKMKIKVIFEKKGEAYFRQQETKAVAQLAKKKNIIIDTGGGIVLNPLNIKRLQKTGILIYLKTSPEWILKRVSLNKKRPLMQVENPMARIKQLLKQRRDLYEKADLTVDTDAKTPKQTAKEIYALLNCHHYECCK